jgi:hypothetical protein
MAGLRRIFFWLWKTAVGVRFLPYQILAPEKGSLLAAETIPGDLPGACVMCNKVRTTQKKKKILNAPQAAVPLPPYLQVFSWCFAQLDLTECGQFVFSKRV